MLNFSNIYEKNLIYFTISKSNGKVDGIRKYKCYDIGDNDFYWLNIPDKINFLVFPENFFLRERYFPRGIDPALD